MSRGKKDTIFIFRYGPIAVFIYKAKPFDIPKVKAIENFLQADLDQGYILLKKEERN